MLADSRLPKRFYGHSLLYAASHFKNESHRASSILLAPRRPVFRQQMDQKRTHGATAALAPSVAVWQLSCQILLLPRLAIAK